MPARKPVDDYAQFTQTCQDSSGTVDACGPKSPDSHRVVWGLTSRPPVPLRASSGFPFARLDLPLRPPSPGFPSSGVLRFVPFGRCPGSGSPSVSLRVPFPLSNFHVSAAAGAVLQALVPGWQGPRSPVLPRPASPGSRDPPALQMGSGWARWDAVTESPDMRPGAGYAVTPRASCRTADIAHARKRRAAPGRDRRDDEERWSRCFGTARRRLGPLVSGAWAKRRLHLFQLRCWGCDATRRCARTGHADRSGSRRS